MFDIPRLYIAAAQWLACMLHVLFFKKRMPNPYAALLCAGWLAMLFSVQVLFGFLPPRAWFWLLNVVVSCCFMALFMFSCCSVGFKDAAYYSISAVIVSEFIASLHWQLYTFFKNSYAFAGEAWFQFVWLAFVYAACFILLCVVNVALFKNCNEIHASFKNIVFIFLVMCFCLWMANIKFFDRSGVWTDRRLQEGLEIRTIIYFCGIVIAYTYGVMRDRLIYMEELNATKNVMDSQYRQYQIYKENDEIVNRHYHDLKHQLDLILGERDTDKRAEYLQDLQKAVKIRQSENKTGNEVVDVVLSGKGLECVKNDITLTVVADGTLLGFMNKMDICSVLGNSLDNAIECVKKYNERDKRIVEFALFRQGDMTVMRVKNHFEEKLSVKGNEVVTSKGNRADHGYGIKSIRYIAEKYGGNMKIVTEEGEFILCLLFPNGGQNDKT